MPARRHVYTVDDLRRLPDEWRVELVAGDLVMAPSPILWHQELVKRLMGELLMFVGRDAWPRVQTAPLDVPIDKKNVYQPDVLVLAEGVKSEGPDWSLPPPIWIAEVISPSTAPHDLDKLPVYARHGVREAWMIYPWDGTVEVYDLLEDTLTEYGRGQSIPSSAIPGFVLDLDEYFRVGQ